MYSGNVLVISCEVVNECGSIKNTNKNIIVTFRFLNSKVCGCACNLYEGLHENVFSSYHYMYHPPSYSKTTIKQHYQRVLYLEQLEEDTFNKQSTKLCCF